MEKEGDEHTGTQIVTWFGCSVLNPAAALEESLPAPVTGHDDGVGSNLWVLFRTRQWELSVQEPLLWAKGHCPLPVVPDMSKITFPLLGWSFTWIDFSFMHSRRLLDSLQLLFQQMLEGLESCSRMRAWEQDTPPAGKRSPHRSAPLAQGWGNRRNFSVCFRLYEINYMSSRRGGCVRHAGCVGEGLLVGKRRIGVDLGRNNHRQQRGKEIKERVRRRYVVAQDSGRDLLCP